MNNQEKIKSFREKLLAEITGEILLPNDPGYEEARKLWNGAISHQPGIIVQPKSLADVRTTVKIAAQMGLQLSVKGGGHDWAGRALNQDGVVISLKYFNKVVIDTAKKEAIVQGGITARELIAAAEPHSLVAVTGTVGVVGFAGLTLGGGYGPLSPSYGLAADNLLSAEVVLANGEVVNASETENTDLYWAIRGGGGNFGIVTMLRIKLHDAKPLLSGMILFPWEEAAKVFEGYNEIMSNAPDELAMLAGMLPANDGSPLLFLLPAWNGDVNDGQKYIDTIKKLGNPIMDDIKQMKFTDFLAIFDPHIGNGLHYAIQTRWLHEFDAKAISSVIDAADNRTSPLSFINIHHFHGAAARVPLHDTAFGIRQPHFMMEFIATWAPENDAKSQEHQEWARQLSASMANEAYPGGYANLLGPDEQEQIGEAFGSNLEKLLITKNKYDEHNFFKGISIPLKSH